MLGGLLLEIRTPAIYVQITLKPTTHNASPQQATVAIGLPKSVSSNESLHENDRGVSRLSVSDLSSDDLTGRQFAQYDLGKRIGQGGMGQVYLAKHRHLGKNVAIKFIRHDLHCREAQGRFLQEIQAVGRLTHPNLIHAIDAGEADGLLFCVTEYLDGHDLYQWVHHRGPMPPRAAAEVIRQAAVGLQFAHQQGFVHRDIKPSNLFLETNGNIRVLDFGLAFQAKQQADLTTQGQLLGTVDFISPEQAHNAHTATPQSDLYSLGASLVYLLSEKPPFPDEQYPSLTNKLCALTTSLPPYLSHCSGLPSELRVVLQRTLNIEASQRYPTARDLALALESCASADELAAWMIHGNRLEKSRGRTLEQPQKSPRRYWGYVAAAAAIALPTAGYLARMKRNEATSTVPVQPIHAPASTASSNTVGEIATESEPEPLLPRRPLRQHDVRPPAIAPKTIVHESGTSRNARAIGAPGKKMAEAISNRKGTP